MTGIGGRSDFNYNDIFQQHQAKEIKDNIDSGLLDKSEVYNAAWNAISGFAEDYYRTLNPISKEKYLELAQKFSQVFPEYRTDIDSINNYFHFAIKTEASSAEDTLTASTDSEQPKEDQDLDLDELISLLEEHLAEPNPKPVQGQSSSTATTLREYMEAIRFAETEEDISDLISQGMDNEMLINAASELIKEYILDTHVLTSSLFVKLESIFSAMRGLGVYQKREANELAEYICKNRADFVGLITDSKPIDVSSLINLKARISRLEYNPVMYFFYEKAEKGLQDQFTIATENFQKQVNEFKSTDPISDHSLVNQYEVLFSLAELTNASVPEQVQKDFSQKVLLPIFQSNASPVMQKALSGKYAELSLDELAQLPEEIDELSGFPLPEQLKLSTIAEGILNSRAAEMRSDPVSATRVHQLLHEFAQREIAGGNNKSAFEIEGKAAAAIPLSTAHPLRDIDQAIVEGTARQLNPRFGAHFSSFDTSIVKGGNLHATQRTIDGKLHNCFDFKVSHYARDELQTHLEAAIHSEADLKAALPPGLCSDLKIKVFQPQQYIRFDEVKNEFTRTGGYSPGPSKSTEIEFEGAGKIIIGNTKENGCMYNWIQVEMDANLPPGEGIKKLHQMLAMVGLGPVLGQQPPESDDRMKIAQLFRAFYPSKASGFDANKEFYQLSIEKLKEKIVDKVPGMARVFEKYLETSPELMVKIEIMPGKEIWGIQDLGQQIKAKGGWGLMTGIGKKSWEEAMDAVERILTQGALSSEQRFQTGTFKQGASSEEDLLGGGGDQVFTRLLNDNLVDIDIDIFSYHGNAQILWNVETVAQRVPYGYHLDHYGVKNRFQPFSYEKSYTDYLSRPSPLDLAQNVKDPNNEMMFKNTLDPSHVIGVAVRTVTQKNDLIKHLLSKGLAEKDSGGDFYIKFAGKRIKADEFIRVGNKFQKKWWG